MAEFILNGSSFFKRLLKNKGAVFGLIIIIISCFTAIFAYFIAPDCSPNANRIIPEIANQKPGFSIFVLNIQRKNIINHTGIFDRLLNGIEDEYLYVPVSSYQIKNDSLTAHKYLGQGVSETAEYSLFSLAQQPVSKKVFWLGTDRFGRDILSRLIVGVRVSLSVGLIAVLISLFIGILLGFLS